MSSGDEQLSCNVKDTGIIMEEAAVVLTKPLESLQGSEEPSENEEEEEASEAHVASNGHFGATTPKRVRKQVQRLSETLNKAHDEKIEQRTKAVKEVFEAGSGTALGDIPRVETTFRKLQPINLKPLHLIVYGRIGSIAEVRSNLRKFRGFPFNAKSEEYEKKLAQIEQRPANEVREALRILSLEVSGTRDVIAARLLDFLIHPSADKVKYKGKVTTGRKSLKKEGEKKTKKKPVTKKMTSKRTSSEGSSKDRSQTEEDADSEVSSDVSSSDGGSSGEEFSASAKKATPKAKNTTKQSAKRRVSLDDSESEADASVSAKIATPKRTKTLKTTVADSDEDAPLSALASSKKPTPPSDSELKESIIALLKTVNLEETSLRVVREQIFSRYPNVDLMGKKDFINTTVKEYLAQS